MRLKIKLPVTLGLLLLSFLSFAEVCPSDAFINNPLNRDFRYPLYIANYASIGTMLLSRDFSSPVTWRDVNIIGGLVICVYQEEGSTATVTAKTQMGMGTWKPVDIRDSDRNHNWLTIASGSTCGQSYTYFSREECTFSR